MSEGEIEVESPTGYPVLPKDVTEEIGSIKLFNKWSFEDVEIRDISLTYASFPLFSAQSQAQAAKKIGRIGALGQAMDRGTWPWMLHRNRGHEADGFAATTSRSALPSTSLTRLVAMPSSASARRSAPSLSV